MEPIRYTHVVDGIRILQPGDEAALDGFLSLHRDSSMFLRSNLRQTGLEYRPAPLHAVYVGRFRGGELAGVAAHAWNGMLLLQSPEGVEDLSRACVQSSGRKVTGLTGPLDQVRRARIAFGLGGAPAAVEADEWLYALDLANIVAPPLLVKGQIICRAARPEERDALCRWRVAYDIETLGAKDSVETRERAASFLDAQMAQGHAWVAVAYDRMVSLAAFNAALPDMVQLGGIYTPPEFRGRGYAKAVVAALLLQARESGVTRAVLFTSNTSAARSYEAVGFERLGDYGLVLLR